MAAGPQFFAQSRLDSGVPAFYAAVMSMLEFARGAARVGPIGHLKPRMVFGRGIAPFSAPRFPGNARRVAGQRSEPV